MTPRPGAEGFDPGMHCGLPTTEQAIYDASVLGALTEIDNIFAKLGVTFPAEIEPITNSGRAITSFGPLEEPPIWLRKQN